eukprot:GFUD01006898.1.p1 GENE.GFUD01006898.1~~GFUD01006898.1.p1  ORF type:complete len:376 (-),score=125.56 GFUD01006898.1:89-1216(-)
MCSRTAWVTSRRLLQSYRNLSCNQSDIKFVFRDDFIGKASVIRNYNQTVRTLVTCQKLHSAGGGKQGDEGTEAGVGTNAENNAPVYVDELKKLSEDILRLKVLDEADGVEKRKVDDELRRLSDELIRIKTQDEVKSKFEEAEQVEIIKLMDDAEIRIKTLEDFKSDSKSLLHELRLKVAEEETKIKALDLRIIEHESVFKKVQDFKIRGETEFKDLKLKVEDREVRLKDLEDYRVKEEARKQAKDESRKQTEEEKKLKQVGELSEEENKLKALGSRIAEEEARVKKLEEGKIKEETEINDIKLKLAEKESRIKVLEEFRVKEEARRKAEKETREKTEKKRSEETQKYFAMIGILVTTATSAGLFYIDHMYKKSKP